MTNANAKKVQGFEMKVEYFESLKAVYASDSKVDVSKRNGLSKAIASVKQKIEDLKNEVEKAPSEGKLLTMQAKAQIEAIKASLKAAKLKIKEEKQKAKELVIAA